MRCQILQAEAPPAPAPALVPGLSFTSVDTETTGVDPKEARVIELGLSVFEDGLPVRDRAYRFDPGIPIPAGASEVHGLYAHHVAGRPSFGSFPPLRQLVASQRLVGYNLLGYDGPVLAAEVARHLGAQVPPPGGLDALVFVRWHLRHLRRRDLGSICLHFRIELGEAHSAAADARAAGEVLVALVRAGLLPADRSEALRVQAEVLPLLQAEQEKWTYHIYTDRHDGSLRLGFGKHCGWPLDETRTVAPFLAWCLEGHDRAARKRDQQQPLGDDRLLPDAVLHEFRRRVPRPKLRAPGAAEQQPVLPQILGAAPAGLHSGGR